MASSFFEDRAGVEEVGGRGRGEGGVGFVK